MLLYIIIMSRTDKINVINKLSEEIRYDIEKYEEYKNLEETSAYFNRSSYKDMRKEINREITGKKINLNNLITELLTVDKNNFSNMNVLD